MFLKNSLIFFSVALVFFFSNTLKLPNLSVDAACFDSAIFLGTSAVTSLTYNGNPALI